MTEIIKILHITAHLGGGVGRVLSRVAIGRRKAGSSIVDSFICLEAPEKKEIITQMHEAGLDVSICTTPSRTEQLITQADIVQLEWWQHPLLTKFMCENIITARLIIWSHTSGLSYPDIPLSFVHTPHTFLFTSPVSHQSIKRGNGIHTVNSSGGFDDIPLIEREPNKRELNYSYLGAPNFSKLHPRIADYLNAVDIPGFKVDFYGDTEANPALRAEQPAGKIALRGFTSSPTDILMKSDVLVYLLNPDHYGTTENALLEAMAAGAVPVVLNNPVESSIVKHKVTGMIVDSVESFANAVTFLNEDRNRLCKMYRAACKDIRERFPLEKTIHDLDVHYHLIMKQKKKAFNFSPIFGSSPHEWFLSCIGKYGKYFSADQKNALVKERLQNPVLYEQSKSSAFQFFKYFPEDKMLKQWASMLKNDLRYKPQQRVNR